MGLSFQNRDSSRLWYWLGRHFLFWAAYFIIVPYQGYLYGINSEYNMVVAYQWLPLLAAIVYSFLYILLPWLLKGQLLRFWIGVIVWSFVLWKGSSLYRYSVLLPPQTGKSLSYTAKSGSDAYTMVIVLMYMSITGIGVSLKLMRQWYKKEIINQQLLQEATLAELQLLKAQIHPHFLFNTLNNLYSLTLKSSDNAAPVVLKLAELLHYMLHECNVATVPLQKEKQVIESYIELEKLRYGKRLQINLDVKGKLSGKNIPPLLLIPFIENAFKHGSSQQMNHAYIHIQLHVIDDELLFTIINTKNETLTTPANFGGIGLTNVKKRLELIYPHLHELQILPEKYSYEIRLKIPLYKMPGSE